MDKFVMALLEKHVDLLELNTFDYLRAAESRLLWLYHEGHQMHQLGDASCLI